MSSKQNDNDLIIHPGNYEEFFILYMDQELNAAQMKMVEDFLAGNPGLQGEFELLMSTKLPSEELSFDKEGLLAENMKLSNVDEDLLLYIDNELPASRRSVVELELASNKNYQEQHRALLQTRLDPAENVVYPFKEALYRKTERTVFFRPWMRIAAAVILLAAGGVLYFTRFSGRDIQPPVTVSVPEKKIPIRLSPDRTPVTSPENNTTPVLGQKRPLETASVKKAQKKAIEVSAPVVERPEKQNDVALLDASEETGLKNRMTDAIKARLITDATASVDPLPQESLNKSIVTSQDPSSYHPKKATPAKPVNDSRNDVAINDRKGSVKGFLRRASRLIEKRTGIDPVNDNGQLLIGMVAVKLK
jgi:hypothetical protein